MTVEEARDNASVLVHPQVVHRLSVAVLFQDIFTNATVSEPLSVSIPSENWSPYRSAADFTYRFLTTNNEPAPSGILELSVEAPGGEYRSFETITVVLPLPPIAHPPPVTRADFLVESPLWPTRTKNIPTGETAVLGRVVSGGVTQVSGLQIFLFEPPGPRPATPYAYADELGEFLFRLPGLRGSVNGGVAVTEAALDVQVLDGGANVAVNPNNITVPLGRTTVLEFTVP